MVINLPARIISGDTLKFSTRLSEYPASEGWLLKVILLAANSRITFNATVSGDDYIFNVSAKETNTWISTQYRYIAKVEKSGEVYTVSAGTTTVYPDFETTMDLDTRSHVEKVLAALEATLEGKATTDQLEISFNGRQVKQLEPGELLTWRDKYRKELNRQKQEEAFAKGETQQGIHKVRFR